VEIATLGGAVRKTVGISKQKEEYGPGDAMDQF
jgi:hypothetical protein